MAISNRIAASPPPASATGGPPTGSAGGSLAGTYPNPTIAASAITTTEILDGTIASGDLAGSIAPSKITGTAITAADTGSVTSTMLLNGTILDADVNASAAIAYSKLNLATSILNADVSASAAIAYAKLALTGAILNADLAGSIAATKLAGAITDDLLLPYFPNLTTMAPTGTWLAANGDPANVASTTGVFTTGVMGFTRLYIPKTITPTKVSIVNSAAASSLTSIATASVSGTQVSPASGAWTLTTSSMSGYASAGVVQVGAGPTDVIAYTAWSGTSMTVAAGGYTPNTSYTNAATLTAILNGIVLYTSAGAYIGSTIDNVGTFTTVSQKTGTIYPQSPTITGGAGVYIWVGVNSVAATPINLRGFSSTHAMLNASPAGTVLTGANCRSGSAGTYTTGATNALVPANLVGTNSPGNYWVALS